MSLIGQPNHSAGYVYCVLFPFPAYQDAAASPPRLTFKHARRRREKAHPLIFTLGYIFMHSPSPEARARPGTPHPARGRRVISVYYKLIISSLTPFSSDYSSYHLVQKLRSGTKGQFSI